MYLYLYSSRQSLLRAFPLPLTTFFLSLQHIIVRRRWSTKHFPSRPESGLYGHTTIYACGHTVTTISDMPVLTTPILPRPRCAGLRVDSKPRVPLMIPTSPSWLRRPTSPLSTKAGAGTSVREPAQWFRWCLVTPRFFHRTSPLLSSRNQPALSGKSSTPKNVWTAYWSHTERGCKCE